MKNTGFSILAVPLKTFPLSSIGLQKCLQTFDWYFKLSVTGLQNEPALLPAGENHLRSAHGLG